LSYHARKNNLAILISCGEREARTTVSLEMTPTALRRACRNTFGVNKTWASNIQGSPAAPNNLGQQGVTPLAY
jgi:hypothetical protein